MRRGRRNAESAPTLHLPRRATAEDGSEGWLPPSSAHRLAFEAEGTLS